MTTETIASADGAPIPPASNLIPAIIMTPTMPTPLPFVSQFPVSTANFAQTFMPHVGNKTPKGKFATPTKQTDKNIRLFLNALVAYEANPTTDGVTTLNNLLTALDMSAIRLQESPTDAVIFYPNQTPNKNTPIVTGCTLVWRFGAVQVPGDPSTYNNPLPQFIVYDPHPGQDGTPYTVTTQFAAGAKALLSHYFNPNVDKNPDFKHGPIKPGNLKRFSDPAHSNTTAFVPFVSQLHTLFPHQGATVSHGMVGKPVFQLLATTDYNSQFLQNGQADFASLLALAIALQQNSKTQEYLLTTVPPVATLCAQLPGHVVRSNGTFAISSNNNSKTIWKLHKACDNTDSVGHMADGGSPFARGKKTDNALLIEFGGQYRGNGSARMAQFAEAQANATKWYMQYDPAIHDLWQLANRFPDVYNNMSLYPQLFNPTFIAAYKANGTNPYNTSSSAAAVADMNSAMSPADDQTTESITETDSSPVLFSSKATAEKQTGFFRNIGSSVAEETVATRVRLR